VVTAKLNKQEFEQDLRKYNKYKCQKTNNSLNVTHISIDECPEENEVSQP